VTENRKNKLDGSRKEGEMRVWMKERGRRSKPKG